MSASLSLDAACRALREGRMIVYPTETFYGIGCNALDPDAVGAVYALKRRPYGLPLPVVIGDAAQLSLVTSEVSPVARALMEAFWPGPLSIIFPAVPEVPDLLTAGAGRIAVRLSSHPAALDLCQKSGLVLGASSANLSGTPPTADLDQLDEDILRAVAGVYAGGPAPAGGEPSTVVDILPGRERFYVRILRPGAVSVEALEAKGFLVDATPR